MAPLMQHIEDIQAAANRMRKNVIELAYRAGANGAHIAPSLSIVDAMAALYCGTMRLDPSNPTWEERDRFILSKGHGALGYYTALAEAGIISQEKLFTFEQEGGDLPGQPSKNESLGIELSSGSLGIGLSVGVGICLANRAKKNDAVTFVLLGDGETNEGSVWEAAMAAMNYHLQNLIVLIDANGMQSDGKTEDVLSTYQPRMWEGFGWDVIHLNGHDIGQMVRAFRHQRSHAHYSIKMESRPLAIVLETHKGYGVSFMQDNNAWHHAVLTKDLYDAAMAELNGASI